ncbi:MAG TPA: contractile injection system tape measure protein [Bacteroidales bacterium]|nr:contractile injection system tape measure protein [Bacteroidales bacterium]HPS17451.1 contractile injection system tape measure protein [Bacteroidales bacterium]
MSVNSLINRLAINFKYSDGIERGIALPLSQEYYETLIQPAIEKVFEKYNQYDIRIEKLEIDLNNLSIEEIPFRLTQFLEEEIIKYIRNNKPEDFKNPEINYQKKEPDLNDKTQAFIYYLKHAIIPWYYCGSDLFDISKITYDIFVRAEIKIDFIYNLLHIISGDKIALQRFYYLTDDEILDKILVSITNATEIKTIYEIITRSIEKLKRKQKEELRKSFFESIIRESYSGQMNMDKVIHTFTDIILQQPRSNVLKKEITTALIISSPEKRIASIMEIFSKHISEKRIFIKSMLYNQDEDISKLNDRYSTETFADSDTKKRIQITNAGLVILNPMIKNLFDALGFIDSGGKFKSENLRQRSVHILQSITGLPGKHYEHLLPLNKIICGMNMLTPVDPIFRIKKQERDEINDMIKAVLEYWSALKSTSVKGLQESFIQRKGTIEKSDKDWILRVENTGIDLLLDELPWSINILNYPWNDYIIHVEWKH